MLADDLEQEDTRNIDTRCRCACLESDGERLEGLGGEGRRRGHAAGSQPRGHAAADPPAEREHRIGRLAGS
eukprot:2767440-Pleurochrysis_carterae.AAC.1